MTALIVISLIFLAGAVLGFVAGIFYTVFRLWS